MDRLGSTLRTTLELRARVAEDLGSTFLVGYRTGALILAIYFSALVGLFHMDPSNPAAPTMAWVSVPVALLMLGCYGVVRGNRVSPGRASWVAGVMVAAVMVHLLIHLALGRNLLLTSDFMLVVVAMALVFPRPAFYHWSLLGVVAAWTASVLVLPLQGERLHWAIGMLSATLVSLAIHQLLRRVLRTQGELRLQDLLREREKAELIQRLEEALDSVKTLRGLIPICAHCKKVRDDQGYWQQVEHFVKERSEASFSHGICPDCEREVRADLVRQGVLPAPEAKQG